MARPALPCQLLAKENEEQSKSLSQMDFLSGDREEIPDTSGGDGSLTTLLVTYISNMTCLLVGIDFMLIVWRYVYPRLAEANVSSWRKKNCTSLNKQEPCSNSQSYHSLESKDWLLLSYFSKSLSMYIHTALLGKGSYFWAPFLHEVFVFCKVTSAVPYSVNSTVL